MKKIKFSIIITLVLLGTSFNGLFFTFLLDNNVLAQTTEPTTQPTDEKGPMTLQVPLGANKVLQYPYLPDYINFLFQYFVGVTAILAAIMFMFAGYKWTFASGNQQVISSAKTTIMNAAVGLILALTSFLLLKTLNPRIVNLEFPVINKPGILAVETQCSGETYQLTGADGNCLDKTEIPPLRLCVNPNLSGGADRVVYGNVAYVERPWEVNCGVSTLNNACITTDNGNRFGTACMDGSKNACFIVGQDGTTNAHFQCMNSFYFADAEDFSFADETWTGADGEEGPNPLRKRLACGNLYWELGGATSGDGLFGTSAYTSWFGRDRSACVINLAKGHTFKRNLEQCGSYWVQGLVNVFCIVGCWNEAWIINENGIPESAGCNNNGGGGGGQVVCSDSYKELLAEENGVSYPKVESTALTDLRNCIETRMENNPLTRGMIDTEQIYTFDRDHDSCNYSKGNPTICDVECSHDPGCHYAIDSSGSRGVDYNAAIPFTEQALFDAINALVGSGGPCEDYVGEICPEASHTHLGAGGCGGDC